MTAIVDTNVVLVANGQHQDVSQACVNHCAERLQQLMNSGRIALDEGFLILLEYQNKTNSKSQKGPGDAFVKWALRNRANPGKCDLVPITEHDQREFEEFPEDKRLENFDPPDRKFVAVAAAHSKHPPILQAADSKWLDWSGPLQDHGIQVDFLCLNDVQRFHANKFG